jgi:sterol desaturase/sphingolipid hydroxylase (fatty acid hydroxylase superfamily)
MKPNKSLVPTLKTFMMQLETLVHRPLYKIMGYAMLGAIIYLPYAYKDMYWTSLLDLFRTREEAGGLIAVGTTLSLMILLNILFGLFYYLRLPLIERFKDNELPWPWEGNPDYWRQIRRAILLNLFNHIVMGGVLGFFSFKNKFLTFRVELSEIPSFPVCLAQICFFALSDDLLFYFGHRFLHTPTMYRLIHKIHHEFYSPISLTGEFAHPLEYLIGNVIPTTSGFLFLMGRAHLLPAVIFLNLRVIETIEAHCGYDFPLSITKLLPLACSSKYHNYHHLKNIGNYCSNFIIWDSIFGTNSVYYQDIEEQEKSTKLK